MLTTNTRLANHYDSTSASEPKSSNLLNGARASSSGQPQAGAASGPEPAVLAGVGRGEQPRNKLFVGQNIKMKGVEVTDCDTLVVEGQIDATLDSRLVHVAESGVFTGTVSVDVAEISGRFEGDLTVRKQLIIHPSGRVSGCICYAKIKVEEGGEISGEISTLSAPPRKVVLLDAFPLQSPTEKERPPAYPGRVELQSNASVGAESPTVSGELKVQAPAI